jgi:hypothetical protein
MTNTNTLRKKQFKAALALADTTMKAWAHAYGERGISVKHLDEVLKGERKPSDALDNAISDFIARPRAPRPRKAAA